MLKINVFSLSADPQIFEVLLPKTALDLGSEAQWVGPIFVHLSLQRTGENILARGKVETKARLLCGRCLAEFETDLGAAIFLLGIPRGSFDRVQAEQDAAPGPNDPSLSPMTGDLWDISEEIRSALVLALPIKPLCQVECPGLCKQCGSRIAEGPCGCGREEKPGSFLALKKLCKPLSDS